MRKPAQLTPWRSQEEMLVWVRESPTREAYQKRLVIWLTSLGRFYAHQIAHMLGLSKQAVWLWVGQYHQQGPPRLNRRGGGGPRWALLSWEQEQDVLARFEQRALRGELISAKEWLPEIEKRAGRPISLAYIYKLLRRHRWRKLGPPPHHVHVHLQAQQDFKKNSPCS